MNSQPSILPSNAANTWGVACRPTLLFVVAFALSSTPHEAVHAIVSYLFGFSSTLFQMWVNPDTVGASPAQLAAIAAAGPIFSLAVGVACWLLYKRRFMRRPSGLVYLMLAIVNIYTFLGPLLGAGLGGDFNTALTFMGVSKVIRNVMSAAGLVLLSSFMFFMGRQLLWWAPRDFGRAKAVACTTAAPCLIGTVLTLLIYWPLPAFLVSSTVGGSMFWAFAVIGAASGCSTARSAGTLPSFTRSDFILTIVAVVMVRLLVNGVRLARF